VIGYYAHHLGEGHVACATAIAPHLRSPLAVLSSRPRPAGWDGEWIELARDDVGDGFAVDPTAGGTVHWAPLHHPGLSRRMATVAEWIDEVRPRLMVVDVSVEVALLARLMGIPVVIMGLPGDRSDAAHRLAYQAATAVLAPWPAWALPAIGADVPLQAVGAISRYAGRSAPARPPGRRVLVLMGRGGSALSAEQLDAARIATPDWEWTALGPPLGDWATDPWPALVEADLVVCHAGQNVIAEVAAARVPAVVIPQARPHDEQRATAAVIAEAGLAVVCPEWPAADAWPGLLTAARRLGGGGWVRWCDGTGPQRAATQLDALAGVPELACAPA
jgi:hypothetical protein